MLQFTTAVTAYLMPDDAVAAESALSTIIQAPAEKWIIMYEASLPSFYSGLTASVAAGHPVHLFADASLAKRVSESAKLQALKAAGVDIAIGTSPLSNQIICHSKVVVVAPTGAPGTSQCWEGSLNFSQAAFAEPNTVLVFSCDQYQQAVAAQWQSLATFARANQPYFQLPGT
jgi:hypothetical protein